MRRPCSRRSSRSSGFIPARRLGTGRSRCAQPNASVAARRRRSSPSTTVTASPSRRVTSPRSSRSYVATSETTVAVAEGPALVLGGYEGTPLADIDSYRAVGGYAQLAKARAMSPQEVTQQIIDSNLRGRGGAFFPTGRKASFIPTPDKIAKPIYLTVNADESEPGTFKDREIMLRVPHRLLEGCLIAAYAIQSQHVFIYIRGEYAEEYRVLEAARAEAERAGLLA